MPPGAKGTTHVIGRFGNSSATAGTIKANEISQTASNA
jgi:hypothetical protein